MTTLSIWTFPGAGGAADALQVLERRQTRGHLVIDDCAVIGWQDGDPRPLAFQAGTADGDAALSGAFWGLLFGSQFLAPLAGLSASGWPSDGLERVGFPDSLLEVMRHRTRPGTSGLFVLSSESAAAQLRDVLPVDDPGTQRMTHRLSPDQEAALRRAFGTDTAPITGSTDGHPYRP